MNSTKKKILAIGLIAAMGATAVIGGTLAYFTDKEQAKNVFTVGEIDIQLHENNNGSPLVESIFGDDDDQNDDDYNEWLATQVFLPGVTLEKDVYINNVGNNDAYVRAKIYVPVDLTPVWDDDINANWTLVESSETVEIDGVENKLYIATAINALEAGQKTADCLTGVTFKPSVTELERVDNYTVLVNAEAIQTAAFTSQDEAWAAFDNQNVTDTKSLNEALANAEPGTAINLADAEYGTITIDSELDGVVISGSENAEVNFVIGPNAKLNNVTFKNLDIADSNTNGGYVGGSVWIQAGAEVNNLVIADSTISGNGSGTAIGIAEISSTVTLDNCTITDARYAVYNSGSPIDALTIKNSTITNISSWVAQFNSGDTIGYNLTIDNCILDNCTGGIAKTLGSELKPGASVSFTNNTLTNCAGHDGSDAKWFTLPASADQITVSGNTLDGAAWTPGTAQGLGK